MDLDALFRQYLDETCDRLGVRLTGRDDERQRLVGFFDEIRLAVIIKIAQISRPELCRHLQQAARRDHLDVRDVRRPPYAAFPRFGIVGRGFQKVRQAPRVAVAGKVLALYRHRRHQARTGRLRQNSDRIVIVRCRTKPAMPPRVVGRVCRDAGDAARLQVSRHLVTDQPDLAQYRRRDSRVRRVIEWRDNKSGRILSLLMDIVNKLREPLLPEKPVDSLSLDEVKHKPVAIIIVAGVVVIKLGRRGSLAFGAERLSIPVSDDLDAVRIRRWYEQEDRVVQYFLGVGVGCRRKLIRKIHRHL